MVRNQWYISTEHGELANQDEEFTEGGLTDESDEHVYFEDEEDETSKSRASGPIIAPATIRFIWNISAITKGKLSILPYFWRTMKNTTWALIFT
ncbi:hypothetical protein BC938DRAFT_475987, partial [Jimgerdemannia flammicorona]